MSTVYSNVYRTEETACHMFHLFSSSSWGLAWSGLVLESQVGKDQQSVDDCTNAMKNAVLMSSSRLAPVAELFWSRGRFELLPTPFPPP